MNFYPHHIGDFDRDTRHLTRIERSIYRDLIELYYDTERPLTLDRTQLCRRVIARSNEEVTAVEQVLNEFFTETATGWFHSRCEKELDEYRANTSQKSMAGKASAEAKRLKKLQALNGKPTPVQQPLKSVEHPSDSAATESNGDSTNQEPRTRNQEPGTNSSVPDGTGADAPLVAKDRVFWFGVPLLTAANVSDKNARSMLAGLCKKWGDEAVAAAIDACAKARPIEPVSWLQAVLIPTKPKNKQEQLEAENQKVADRYLEGMTDETV